MKYALGLAIIFVWVATADLVFARYDTSKVNDWKFHAYFCKNVVLHLTTAARVEAKHGKEVVDQQSDQLKKVIINHTLKHEEAYPFDAEDAQMIADMVFSVRAGMDEGGVPLTIGSAQNQGFDICVSILDNIDKKLSK